MVFAGNDGFATLRAPHRALADRSEFLLHSSGSWRDVRLITIDPRSKQHVYIGVEAAAPARRCARPARLVLHPMAAPSASTRLGHHARSIRDAAARRDDEPDRRSGLCVAGERGVEDCDSKTPSSSFSSKKTYIPVLRARISVGYSTWLQPGGCGSNPSGRARSLFNAHRKGPFSLRAAPDVSSILAHSAAMPVPPEPRQCGRAAYPRLATSRRAVPCEAGPRAPCGPPPVASGSAATSEGCGEAAARLLRGASSSCPSMRGRSCIATTARAMPMRKTGSMPVLVRHSTMRSSTGCHDLEEPVTAAGRPSCAEPSATSRSSAGCSSSMAKQE